MTHRWLVGILAGVLLSGSAMLAQQKPAATVPTGEWFSAASRCRAQ